MARTHVWKFLVNQAGEPIENANIYITLAGSDTAAWVYFDEYGSSGSRTAPQTTSLENGYFEFWIDEDNEYEPDEEIDDLTATEYPYTQKFKIRWEKTGIASGYVDYINVFPSNKYYEAVDETDSASTSKNKLVSNALAYAWNQHTNWDVRVDGLGVHGLEWVQVDQPNDIQNKIITNRNGWKWESHVDSTIQAPVSGAGNPHNIYEVDPSSTNIVRNKVVSNADIYNIYAAMTQSTVFTVSTGDWSLNGDGDYEYLLTHSLGETWPCVEGWNDDTNDKIMFNEVDLINSNIVRLIIGPVAFNAKVRVTV